MNAKDFEKKLFALLFRSTQRITPHFVAYQLDMPFEEAQKQLDQLAAKGALRVEIDDAGGIWYEAPGVERGKEQASAAQFVSYPQPESVRVVRSPARFLNVFSIAAMVLGGMLLFKLLVPLLIVAMLFGFARRGMSYCGSYCHNHSRYYDWHRW